MTHGPFDHTCWVCGGIAASKPRSKVDKHGRTVVVGWAHSECAQQIAEAARRRRLAKAAGRWRQAGQEQLPLSGEEE